MKKIQMLKKGSLIAIGLASLTAKKVNELSKELVKKGQITQKQGEQMAKKAISFAMKEERRILSEVTKSAKRVMDVAKIEAKRLRKTAKFKKQAKKSSCKKKSSVKRKKKR